MINPPPPELSLDEAYPGYAEDAIYEGANIIIKLNGVEQRDVIAYSVPRGEVVRYALDERGNVIPESDDDLKLETVRGRVEVSRKHAA